MKIRPVVDDFFHADGRSDMTQLMSLFAILRKVPINIFKFTALFMVVNWYYCGINEYRQHTSAEIHTDKLAAYGKLELKPNPHTIQA